jgi:alpha-ketoglutarate-dependent taurine dioxygenase
MSYASKYRIGFGAELDASKLLVHVDDTEHFDEKTFEPVAERFNKYGVAVLVCKDRSEPRINSVALKQYFGNVILHDRADEDGIVPIDPSDPIPGYLGSTCAEHPPHTDGAFSLEPEQILTLQCVVATTDGGLTQLISGDSAYDYMARNHAKLLPALFRPDAMSIQRTGIRCLRPVFNWVGGRVQMVYREDDVASTIIHPEAVEAFSVLRDFVTDPENIVEFRLQPNWIVVLDNLRLLHGRTSFPTSQPRRMNRLNFDGTGPFGRYLSFGIVPEYSELSQAA